MGSLWKVAGLALVLALVVPAFADDTADMEEPSIEAVVIAFRATGNADSAAIEKDVLTSLRKAYAEQSVLFIDIDLTSKGSAHQGRLLLTATGLAPLFATHGKKPGTAVIWDAFNEKVALAVTAKTKAAEATAAIKRVLEADEDEDEEKDG